MNTTTLKLAGYQHLKYESGRFETTMSKPKYTLEEVHQYHLDILEQEDKLDSAAKGTMRHKIYEDTLHVMLEVYSRMQESLRDAGPRKSHTLLERLLRKSR